MEGFNKKRRVDVQIESKFRAWDDLAPDLLGLIFKNLGLQVLLQVIARVCKPWYKVVQGPYCWQRIDIDGWIARDKYEKLDRMLRMLVTRSSGSLRELYVSNISDDQMLFVADHARSLETLTLRRSCITDAIVEQVAPKLSSLTTLDISYCDEISARALSAIGTNCKALSSLTWKMHQTRNPEFDEPPRPSHAKEGQAIARTMPKLKRLSIPYVNINTGAALEILSGCPELEFLNIKGCWEVYFRGFVLQEKYPKITVLLDDDEDSDDKSYEWDTWNDASSGISSPGVDDGSWMIDAYTL